MKIKKNFPIKLLTFLLAVLCLAGFAVGACFQIMEIDILWGNEDISSSRQIHRMMAEDFGDIYYMLSLRQDTDRNALQEQELKELEDRFAAENTNLRWQIRDWNDSLLHGNIGGELPAAAYDGYWYRFSMSSSVSTSSTFDNLREFYAPEAPPVPMRCEDWPSELADAVTRWQSGERTDDPDAIYTDPDGNTLLLIIEKYDGTVVYAPTIRAALETNADGYRYDPGSLRWVRMDSSNDFVYIVMWPSESLPVTDGYSEALLVMERWQSSRVLLLIATASAALAWLLLTICLCVWSGWRKGHEGVSLCWFHRIPGDLLLACYVFLGVMLAVLLADSSYYIWEQNDIPLWGQLTLAGLFGGGAAILVTSFLITLCARCKGRVVLRNMIVVRFLIWLYRTAKAVLRAIPLIWKTALGCLLYAVISFLFIFHYRWFPWIIFTLLVMIYLLWWAFQWALLRRGAKEIIGGNSACHIENWNMPPDLKEHAADLNRLGETISAAVDDRMRSEHFKAELITNVSHDLKTPLTSIINYVDLLKKEDIGNPRAVEYIEVLDRKSQRLKKLTEDLVEASKASTGSLTVVAERLDLVQLVDQALAEYQERLESRGLSIVRTLPTQPVWVRADGRHLWRVVDNLLSNCAKYSLEGTRVYAEVEQFADCAELRVKNISRDALNVDPDTLMERFVRGDESRTTEGSGLGLSIAQSLTDLQEGSFHIAIDGDLFKATVRLPLAE